MGVSDTYGQYKREQSTFLPQRAEMRHRNKIQELNAIKRRLLDDLLRVKERASLFGTGLVRTPALYREWEECITHRFRQLLELSKGLPIAKNPFKWAEAAIAEVLQPFSEDRELLRVFQRVYDEEFLRASKREPAGTQATTVKQRSPKKLTAGQQAVVELAKLWRSNPGASYKEIYEFADNKKVPTPWQDCLTWDVAAAKREPAWKTLCGKARAISKRDVTLT